MDADGANQQRLTRDGWDDRDPAWSPDGRKIAFAVIGDVNSFIVVMNADGTDRRTLPEDMLNGVPMANAYPAWSPDGRKIAYYSSIVGENKGGIHLMTADGKHLKRLGNSRKGHDYDPDWFDPTTLSVFPTNEQHTIWGKLKKLEPNPR